MARPEWLRTFLAVYRAGSVSEGARRRHLSQPAASQQIAALERSVGHALFARGSDGVTPTPRGRELYGEIAESLDRLETVLQSLDAGRVRPSEPVVRVGAVPEYFASVVVPALARHEVRVRAAFGADGELLDQVAKGELDVAGRACRRSRGTRRAVRPTCCGRRSPSSSPRCPDRRGAARANRPSQRRTSTLRSS